MRRVDDVVVCRGGDGIIRFRSVADSSVARFSFCGCYCTAGVKIVIISPHFYLIGLFAFGRADPGTWGSAGGASGPATAAVVVPIEVPTRRLWCQWHQLSAVKCGIVSVRITGNPFLPKVNVLDIM